MRVQAANLGLQGSAANTLGSLKVVGKINVANTALGVAITPLLPEFNLDARDLFNEVQNFRNSVTDFLDNTTISATSSAVGGGFVLYPNKPNTNMMQSVYAK